MINFMVAFATLADHSLIHRAGLWLCGALCQSILWGPITHTARNPRIH